jgi:hypothetical protein
MSGHELVAGRNPEEGEFMMRRGMGRAGRLAAVAGAMALVVSLAGDRGRASTVPAVINGQDPLEVLALKVRPNVIVVLDSSGSMTNTAPETFNTNSGDNPRSKLYQAKVVLKQVIQANQDKVSFQMGTYTQYSEDFYNQNAGDNRFQYIASGQDFPFMTAAATELTLQGARGDSLGRGLQSWQIINPAWGTLYYGENNGGTTVVCTAALPLGGAPRFYASGSDLATALQNAMNSATCTGGSRANTYTVTYNTGAGTFTFGSNAVRSFQIRWADTPNSIRGALGRPTSGNSSFTTGTISSNTPYTLLYRTTGTGSSGTGLNTRWRFSEEIPPSSGTFVNFYQLRAGRLWDGEVVYVNPSGETCAMDFPTAATQTSPPSVYLQAADASCNPLTDRATFAYGGGDFGGNNRSCQGFRSKSSLVPCDLRTPPAPNQASMIDPYIDTEIPFDATGAAADWNGDGTPDYVERQDGTWAVSSINIAPSAKADGSTPIANSLIDIKGLPDGSNTCITNPLPAPGGFDLNSVNGNVGACVQRNFSLLWNNGQTGTTNMAGPPPWQLDPIKNHRNPKEKTIVLFVTDGDDTCGYYRSGGGATDTNALRAAYWAEQLYRPINAAEPASSVQTYVVGFGGAFTGGEPYRLNWIAWGGSGLGQGNVGQPAIADDGNRWTESSTSITNKRAQCDTCQDAFVAPDAATLAAQLQGIIDQGASQGEFNAQQSITETVFEYVDLAPPPGTQPYNFDSRNPGSRYGAIVPTRVVSSFTLPGFKGQVRAYQNDGAGNSVLKWSAGDVLWQKISNGMLAACPANGTTGAALGECGFAQLHGGATDSTIATSSAAIKRRVYTTNRNGVFPYDPRSLMAGNASGRVALWPPDPGVAPTDYTTQGQFDQEMGLPLDAPTCTLDTSKYTSCEQQEFAVLQNDFGACVGNNRPAACTSGSAPGQMKAARKEARDMILAFMAGAKTVPDSGGPKRAFGANGSVGYGDILYAARSWALADSENATVSVVGQPLGKPKSLSGTDRTLPLATPWTDEYVLYRDGPSSVTNRPNSDTLIKQGFGLRSPDDDTPVPPLAAGAPDLRRALKPVMTVVYSPGNDMLHAFRAGPCYSPSTSPTTCYGSTVTENGGEELWGFVPYDQLEVLRLRLVNDPQGRDNHVYSLARAVRFSDVFVPWPPGDPTPQAIDTDGDGTAESSVAGVWRRILFIPRGIGGKYLTALDVTAPAPYTESALSTTGPIPLWSRGNPDTQRGPLGGSDNNSFNSNDVLAYAHMGETWSLPAIAYIDKTQSALYKTNRRADGVDYVLFLGSGYGSAPGEGTTFYALDALTGDVVAATDVEGVAATNGLTRAPGAPPYTNALVANVVGFNPGAFSPVETVHPAATKTTRLYFGDLHGRLWKVLTAAPDVVIPAADLGADQPVGTAVALLGLPPQPDASVPYIFLSSGNDRRADGPFKNFGFRDDGTDTELTIGSPVTLNGVNTFPPVVSLYTRQYDPGTPEANCGYTAEAVFRGTVQPTTAFACPDGTADCLANKTAVTSDLLGRVFFSGTRLSLPNTRFAPPTPLACGTGDYPCRSQFDSIIYALGAETGLAAYDLNATGDDAYRIFRDSRLTAIEMLADPDPGRGGSSFNPDEGQMKGTPSPPPPPGVPPTSQTNTANVIQTRQPGQPPPSVHYGSTVCQ